jgi:hypothetical protein
MLNVSELNLLNTHSFLLQSVGVSAQMQTLGHQSPGSNLQMADQDQSPGNFHPLKVHSVLLFDSHLRFLLLSSLNRLYPPSF